MSSYNPVAAGSDMSARNKLNQTKRELQKTLSGGKASPTFDDGTEVVDCDPQVVVRLNAAKAELAHTLSGGKSNQQKQNAAPTLAKAKDDLIKTMSNGRAPVAETPLEESTIHYMTPSGHTIASTVTEGSIQKLNEAKESWRRTLSGQAPAAAPTTSSMPQRDPNLTPDAQMKHNAAQRDARGMMAGIEDATKIAVAKDSLVRTMQKQNAFGIPNQGYDSGNTTTPSGIPYAPDHPITCRGRSYEQLLAEESASKPTSVPAVASGQDADEDGNIDGDNDWSPSQAQGKDFDASVDNTPFDRDEATNDLLNTFTGKDGRIRKQQASPYFLTVSGDGSSRDHYAVPLAKMNKVSLAVDYSPEALDEAFAIASGRDNGMAVRALQNRVIRIKKRAGFDLTPDQADYQERHMSAPSLYYDVAPSPEEIDDQLLKYDSQYMAALKSLQKAVRSK